MPGVDSQGMESLDEEVCSYNWIPSQIVSIYRESQSGRFCVVDRARRIKTRWKIGRIEAVYPGQDGLVRVVDMGTGESVVRRPITRLSPLETGCSY